MRRITRLLIGAPELRPLGAALLGVWACACRAALGAGGVVVLVGPVGGGPVGRVVMAPEMESPGMRGCGSSKSGMGARLSRRLRLRLEAISVLGILPCDFLANLDQAPRRLFFVG